MEKENRIRADRKEILRYLGCRTGEAEETLTAAVDSCIAELEPLLEPKCIWQSFPLEQTEENRFRIEGMVITSGSLGRNLRGCSEVYLMAATIGFAPDRLSGRSAVLGKVSRSVIFQAAGAAFIESWCDAVNDDIRRDAAVRGLYCRPRFSPGYGDFSLKHQTEFFRILNVQKTIGVSLTESLLMMPSKSVTALIGVSPQNTECILQGCESCGNTACSFRR